MVAQHQAMDEESRSQIVTNLIRTLSPKIGVQILPADVRVVTRRPPKPAAADTAAPSGIRLPTTTGCGFAPLRSEADMWLRLAEGLLPAYDQPHPCEAAADQPAAASADVLALAGVRAWAENEADTYADDAVICPPTRTLLAFLEVREIWKARRSADSVRLELLDPEAARLLQDVCRDAVLALPFGDQSQGRAVIQVTVEHSEDREDQPTTPLPGVLPPALSKQFFRCAYTAKAICTGPLANLELPAVEQLAEAIAATISQRTNTPPELHHAQWLTDTMTAAGVEMHHHHTEPTLLRVGDDNLCAISFGKEDEEFADTLRLEVALTSLVALLRAIRLRTIVIYLTESEFDPSELLIHPFSQTIREAGELDQGRASSGTSREAPCRHITSPATGRPNRITSSSDPNSPNRTHATAPAATTTTGAHADDEEELDLNYEEMDSAMEVDTTQVRKHIAATNTGGRNEAYRIKSEMPDLVISFFTKFALLACAPQLLAISAPNISDEL
eukprot:jgi/Tetstr1/422370/TSEL_013210.t1